MNSKFSNNRLILVVAVAVLAMAGCTSNMDELERYVGEVKQRPADPIDPIPPVNTYDPFLYTAIADRDPFQQVTSEAAETPGGSGDGPRPDANRPREFLEKFSLDTLGMVGTFSRGQENWVLVEDPDNVIHRIAVGNYMGQNHGRVIGIYPDKVEMTELIPDGGGNWLVREVSMALEDS